MIENIKKFSQTISVNPVNVLMCVLVAFGIAISSQISIPLPNGVPMTLQTFSVALIGFMFAKINCVKSILTYLLIGALGIPVFAQAKGGIASLFGLTGGFLLGFIPFVFLCAKSMEYKNLFIKVLISILGLLSCHLLGVLQYGILTGVGFTKAALLVSIPFLAKDLVSVAFAFVTANGIKLIGQKIKK